MATVNEAGFSAFVGLDWSDTKHDVCLQAAGSVRREHDCIPHRADAIDDWVQGLRARHGGKIAVILEQARGPLVYALQKYDCIALVPVNPAMLAKYRQAFHPSGAKDDPTDAELMLDLVLRHPRRFSVLTPQSKDMRQLRLLVEQRRQLVQDRVRLTNRLSSALKQYYPQALEWFERLDAVMFCDFIERWPTPVQARRARPSTLERFFRAHHLYRKSIIERRIAAIRSASPLTLDEAVISAHCLQVEAIVAQLRATLTAIARYDEAINGLAAQQPDYDFFASLPGAGAALAPRLLVAFGDDRDRFDNAAELQMYAGIAPVTSRSGKMAWVHWRWQCPTFLRQTFVEWAAHTVSQSQWAGAFYRRQRAKGAGHHAAIRALAFKWIRILYRCWKTGEFYDESRYLEALKHRGSPLAAS